MEWLKEIFDKLLSVFPCIIIIAPYEAAVRITCGKACTPLYKGWYMYWPLIQRVIWMEIQTQVVDLRVQSVRTKDSKDIIISGAVQYNIKNIYNAIVNIQDVDKAIETLSLGIILEFVHNKTLSECQDVEGLKSEILKGLREAAKGWGIKVEKVFITDLGKSRNIRLLTNKIEEVE